MVFSYLLIAEATHYNIIMVVRTALDSFIVDNAKGSIVIAKKYFIIKKFLFVFRKKFATTNNKKRYC